MDADAEGDVRVHSAIDDDFIWVGELLRVAVGRGEVHQDALAFGEFAAVVLRIFGDVAGHRHGRVRAQKLFDGGRDQSRFSDEPRAVLGVLGEMPERRADATPGGVDAGEEQEERRAEHVRLGDRLAIDLSVEEVGNQVVFRVLLVLLNAVPEVEEDHSPRLAADLGIL